MCLCGVSEACVCLCGAFALACVCGVCVRYLCMYVCMDL